MKPMQVIHFYQNLDAIFVAISYKQIIILIHAIFTRFSFPLQSCNRPTYWIVSSTMGAITQAKKGWRARNAMIDLNWSEQEPSLMVPPTSAFCNQVAFTSGPQAVVIFRAELKEVMIHPTASCIPEHFMLAKNSPPVIDPTAYNFWCYHRFLRTPYDNPSCNL